MERIVVAISPPSIFTLGSLRVLRRSSLTAADLGFLGLSPVMLWVWSGYGLGMVWVWSGYGVGLVWVWSGYALGMLWV